MAGRQNSSAMNFGFSTFFFIQRPIQDAIDHIVSHGVKTIELSLETPYTWSMDDGFVKKLVAFREEGVDFSIHAPFFEMNLGSFQKEIRRFSKERARAALDLAYRIGANPVVMHPGYNFWIGKTEDGVMRSWEYFVKDMKGLITYGRKRNITIALESIPMHFFLFHDLPEFKTLEEAMPGLGMTLDIGHAYVTKIAKKVEYPEEAIIDDLKRLGPGKVTHVHLHNNRGKRDDHLITEGKIDLKRILAHLDREGYTGKVIVESHEMERNGIPSVLRFLDTLSP
jgi:sugar phosphate isomerase/epimerase